MRRILALLGLLVLVASLPATATAGRATRFTDHSVGFFCDGIEAGDGAFAFVGVGLSDTFGPGAELVYWAGGDPEELPDLVGDFDVPPTVTWDGTMLSGSIPLLTIEGQPAGVATFAATLTPTGDPSVFDDRFRDGNTWHQFSGVDQPMQVAGTLVVDGSTFSLDGCFGNESTITVFETAPRSFVTHFVDRSTRCQLENADGDTAFLFAALQDNGLVFVDVAASSADGTTNVGAIGDIPFVDGVVDGDLTTYDLDTGEPSGSPASLHLEVVGATDPIDFMLQNATIRQTVRGTTLDLEGTLTIEGMTFDLGACVAVDADVKLIATFPNGPKPGGKVPANDLPTGAKLLGVGDRASVSTKGASPEREASYECLTFGEDDGVFEIPVGHTVWYRIEGTGGTVTVDTAGSDYDTVAAVYTSDGAGGFLPVEGACVDDVPVDPIGRTLQAAVSWETEIGTTYYVQIGGFPESMPYGNLRVAVY